MTTQTTQTQPDLSLQIRRVIKASRHRVFEAWTKPELLQKWFGPAVLAVRSVTADVRVGGTYRFEMESVSGEPVPPRHAMATGKYTEIVPDERLSFTWRGDWADMGDTLVTLEFKDAPGGTEIILTHTNFANVDVLKGHNKGWEESFEKLAKFVA